MARAVANDRFVSVALSGAREAVARRVAEVAREEIARVEARFSPSSTTVYVDGREGAAIDRVVHVVHARFGYMGRIVEAGLDILRTTSPVESGEYQREHRAFVEGETTTDAARIASARRVVVSNDVPYARIVEVGVKGRVPFSKQAQVPREGVYRHAARELRRRFGHLADIEFGWVGIDSGSTISGSSSRSLRFPCVSIEARK